MERYKEISFSLRENYTQCTYTISTCFNFMCRNCASPDIQNNLKEGPDCIYEMPIDNSQIESNCIGCVSLFQLKKTNSQIDSSNQNMKSMKPSCLIETTSINSITKCKSRRSVFHILTVHKESSQSNCKHKINATQIFFLCIKCMFCCICSKIRSQQNQSICFRKSSPMKRNNSKRWPRHSNLNSGHQCCMQKSPLKTNKEHPFTPNKLLHSQVLPIFYLSSMKTKNSFTNNITPPQSCNICQTKQSPSQESTSSSILVKKQNQRNSLPQHTQSSQCRPRTRIHKMISMMWSICCTCLNSFFCKKEVF